MNNNSALALLKEMPQIQARKAAELWKLVQAASEESKEEYDAVWAKLVERSGDVLQTFSLATCKTLEQLQRASLLAPDARFELQLNKDGEERLVEALTEPALACVHTLHVTYVKNASTIASLFASPHISSLRRLELVNCLGGTKNFIDLLELARPAYITSIAITRSSLSNVYLSAPEPHTGRRETLKITNTPKPLLQGLEELDLSHNQLENPHIASWMQTSDQSATCRRLRLENNLLTNETFINIITSPVMRSLEALHYAYNQLMTIQADEEAGETTNAYTALLHTDHLPQLRLLDISHNVSIHQKELEALQDNPKCLPALAELLCDGTHIKEDGLLSKLAQKFGF